MNRRTPFSIVAAAAAVTVAAGGAQGALTLYQGLPYSATGTGYKSPSIPVQPGMTAGNGTGVGNELTYVNGTYNGVTQGLVINSSGNGGTGNVVLLQPLATSSAGRSSSQPYAINPSGTTAGYSLQYNGTTSGQAPVAWNAAGAVTPLQNLGVDVNGNPFGAAVAINANGIAAGNDAQTLSSPGTATQLYAATWDTSTAAISKLAVFSTGTFGTTAGQFYAQAYAINSAGTSVGTARVYSSTSTSTGTAPVLWAAGTAGTMTATALGTLGTATTGLTSGFAYAVNDQGVSAGQVADYNAAGTRLGLAPARWDASGAVTPLGTLGVASTNNQFIGQANAINYAGTAVGNSAEYTAAGASVGTRATVWAAGSSAVNELPNLGTLSSGNTTSNAYSINDDGLIVGSATAYSGGVSLGSHATLWVPDATAASGYDVDDLNSLLNPTDASNYVLNTAYSISSSDWVTASETNLQTNTTEEVLFNVSALDPVAVPEPTSLAVIASATAVPLLGRRRRRIG